MNVDTLFAEAQRRHREGALSEAEALYRRILTQDGAHAEALHYLGVLHMQQDRLAEAEAEMRRSLAVKPGEPAVHVNLGVLLQRQNRDEEALACFKAALALDPFRTTALLGLGEAQRALGRLEEAILAARKAAAIEPRNGELSAFLGIALHDAGKSEEALTWLDKAIKLRPSDARIRYNRGTVLQALARPDDAAESYRAALALDPGFVEAYHNLALLLAEQQRPVEAITHLTMAVELAPARAAIRNSLGKVLTQLGRFEEAAACFRAALDLDPRFTEARINLGVTERSLGRPEVSEMTLRQAVAERPDLAEAHNNLGLARRQIGQLDEAYASITRAIELRPDLAELHSNLGLVLNEYGTNDEALASLRRAIALKPDSMAIQRSLLGVLVYCDVSEAERFAEHRRFGALAEFEARPLTPRPEPGDPRRRLRVGYLSSDFSTHPVARNMLPVLKYRDRATTEVFAYADVSAPTAMTAQVEQQVDRWRSIVGWSDEQVAAAIRDDGIDILVLLAGRFDKNRPQIAAYRAAPIQVSFHDPGTSGLEDMHYLIADRVLVPRGAEERFSERVIRLPSFYIHDPIDAPDVGPLPADTNGHITFGVVNNPVKLSDASLRLFAETLAAVPGSRLFVRFRDLYRSERLRERVLAALARAGVEHERATIVGLNVSDAPHLTMYNGFDIALDTTPFTGSTTTFESLWMGVPVMTLRGRTMVGRWSASMLTALRLEALIAETPAGFVAAAAGLAADRRRLAALRAELRGRVAASSLCDGARRARQLERTYRALWRRRCAGGRGS